MFQRIIGFLHACRPFKGRIRILSFLLRFASYAPTYYGPLMYSRPKDWTNRAAIWGALGDDLKNLIHAMPNDGVFIDFGANAGIFSLLAASHLKNGYVYSFEPNKKVFADLCMNIALNKLNNILPFNFGIAIETQTVAFSFSDIHTGAGKIISGEGASTEKILLVNFREVLRVMELEHGKTIICKIDTEGAELQILKTLEEFRIIEMIDVFFVEIDSELLRNQGGSTEAVYQLLEDHGFSPEEKIDNDRHYDEIFWNTRSYRCALISKVVMPRLDRGIQFLTC